MFSCVLFQFFHNLLVKQELLSSYHIDKLSFSSHFSCSVMSDSLRLHGLQHANSQSLLKLMSIGLVMATNHLILCHPLLLLPSTFPSIRVFSNESILRIRQPKYWSFSFNISPSNEYSGLVSFRILGEGNGHPLQYSCLEYPMDRGAWRSTVHGVGHD